MARSRFDYFSPESLGEAIEILKQNGDAKVMAGGTDLLVRIKEGATKTGAVVGLKNIEHLRSVAFSRKKGLTIGATALLADVAQHASIQRYYPGIAEAARGTANVQIRNMGTVVGNVCNASPSADNIPMLLVLGGTLNIMGPNGERKVPLGEFFKGPGITDLAKDEIVESVHVPFPAPRTGMSYLSLSARGQVDCAAVNVGVKITMENDVCTDARIAIGACGPTPIQPLDAQTVLVGNTPTDNLINETAKSALQAVLPINDVRASAPYRTRIVEVLVKRSIKAALKNIA